LLFLRYRPCQAFVRSITQRFSSGVKPFVPAGTMLGHPGVQGMIVILLIRKDRDETRKVLWRDVAEQERGRYSIIKTGTGNQDDQ
jgi:hypothetical protein